MSSTLNRENATCQWLKATTSYYDSAEDELSQGFCPPDFDKSLCWFNVSLGSTGERACPFAFCPSVPGCETVAEVYKASRQCHENGSWAESVYSECINLLRSSHHQHCVVGYCRTCPDPLRETVISVSLSLSIVSVVVLLSALLLFSAFDSVQCRRLSIHKNLAAAFLFRFSVLAVWTLVNFNNLFRDCSNFVPFPLRNLEWLCKSILWMVIYFQVASVMWMLIEGVYLYSRFTIFAMRRSEAPYAFYLLTGWGVPFVVVMAWTIVHEHQSGLRNGSFCWLPYAQGAHLWILAGTMGVALVLNVLLLLLIVVILVQKLRSESAAESKKLWRTVKATILLVPLLGVSNIPLFYEPSKPSAFYMLGSAILQHSQGIFIAVLYCFLNGEIQNAMRRQMSKVPLLHSFGFSSRQRLLFETERTYVPAHTTTETEKSGGLRLTKARRGDRGGGDVRMESTFCWPLLWGRTTPTAGSAI
uniref:G_PROTEIN_RECEP_F2_4 domain-containing protein n=1 Tax=Globodera pallida TaxID=36090 RepID=A0A183CD04_GLOPA